MIVKVQLSLFVAGGRVPNASRVLIYPKDREWMVELHPRLLPFRVLKSLKRRGGKEYWHATFNDETGTVKFGGHAPVQDW